MATRGRGRSRAARKAQPPPQPFLGTGSDMDTEDTEPAPLPTKRRTIADNFRSIESIETQLATMSQLLHQMSDRMAPPTQNRDHSRRLEVPQAPKASNFPSSADAYPNNDFSYDFSESPRRRHGSQPYDVPRTYHPRSRHVTSASGRAHPHGGHHADPLGDIPAGRRQHALPTTLHDIGESGELQDRVANLLTATLAPLQPNGKRLFAHCYVLRGSKKAKTTLGDLTLAEYNLGFMRMMNNSAIEPADRPHMFRHIQMVNEDAAVYDWQGVRNWSEEVCALVNDDTMSWEDYYHIDLLRLKLSRVRRGRQTEPTRDLGAFDNLPDISPEVRAARPAPPCRHFNGGSCTHRTHHTVNGFRYLHICSSCILNKCQYLPHSEKDCKSKDFKRKSPKDKDQELGFGK